MRLIHALALVGLAVLVPVGNPGCSKYGEGSICDPLNNDPQTNISNDCDDGLVCTQSLCAATAICCPPPGHAVTSPACNGALMNCNGTGGGTNAGGGGATGSNVGGFGGAAAPACPHDQCVIGAPLIAGYKAETKDDPECTMPGDRCPPGKTCVDGICRTPICSQCVNDICNGVTLDDGTVIPADPECCGTHAWDMFCVDKVKTVCKIDCNFGTGGSGGGTGGNTTTSNGGAGGSSSTGT